MHSKTPYWLKKRLVVSEDIFRTKDILSEAGVGTICESSLCPNLNECFSKKQATFLILGKTCTRNCAFCSVEKGSPGAVAFDEAEKISIAATRLGLKYVVITSVTRDDLPDGGASQFVKAIDTVRRYSRDIKIEILIPDFGGNAGSLERIVRARPDVLAHNIETVERIYPIVRPGASYRRSLKILKSAKEINPDQITKSGIMAGLGETKKELVSTIQDIGMTGCDILTIGQYMKPRPWNLAVDRIITPQEFEYYEGIGNKAGFKTVITGPFVRSSYGAYEAYKNRKDILNDRCCAAAIG